MLYQKIACKMAEYLEREAVIEKEQKEECAYGLEMLISSICLAGMLFGVAEEQWTSEVSIDAIRGKILDRNGKELAVYFKPGTSAKF